MKKAFGKKKKKKKCLYIYRICWIAIPGLIALLLVLDALKLYTFTTQRLILIGAGIVVLLIPFIKEITVKDLSFKKEDPPR